MPARDDSLHPHVWYAQVGQIPKAAAALTSKDQTKSKIHIEGDDFPMQVHTKYLLTLD